MKPHAFRAAAVAAALLLSACSKVTAENYAKIGVGMAYADVTAILGSPASCNDTVGFKVCRWGDDKRSITVRFAADKVVLHSADNIR
jgi:outer membrane protein assembly factor BamE (lipoprotein component of BamABCDE complex)